MAWVKAFDQPAPATGASDALDDLEDLSIFSDGENRKGDTVATKPPATPPQPTVDDVADCSVRVCWTALTNSSITAITCQAMPAPRKKKATHKVFDKFSTRKRSGGVETVVKRDITNTTSTMLVELKPNTAYLLRLVVSNAKGSTSSELAEFTTLAAGSRSDSGSNTPAASGRKAAKSASKDAKVAAAAVSAKKNADTANKGNKGADAAAAGAPAPTKAIVNRLGGSSLAVSTPAEEAPKSGANKLFQAPKGPERSKIWQALNPDKLYFESRREQAEREKTVISVRGGGEATETFGFVMRDEEGNIIEEENEEGEEEEEDFDPNNLPDFGEFEEEMKKLRAERDEKLRERQEQLRKNYEAKKAQEQAAYEAELAQIRAREAQELKKVDLSMDQVVEAQKRIEAEFMAAFTFKTG